MKATKHETKSTSNHRVIRQWAEERGGTPATVANTQRDGEDIGILRIDFPGGASDPPLTPITWDEFFEKFDDAELAMLYQDQKADGETSTFCKFVNRGSV